MSGVKHTPGPWFIISHPDGWSVQDRVGGAGRCVARDYGDTSTANARLIAVAPDLEQDGSFLLDRLDEFESELQDDDVARQFYGHVSPALARFRATIARARGES